MEYKSLRFYKKKFNVDSLDKIIQILLQVNAFLCRGRVRPPLSLAAFAHLAGKPLGQKSVRAVAHAYAPRHTLSCPAGCITFQFAVQRVLPLL